MVSRPVPGGGFGGGYGHGGRPSGGDVWAGWFGAAGSGPEMGVSGQNKGRPHLNCTPKVGHNFWGVL